NYQRIRSTANGKVYEWLAPIAGVPQGDYEPVLLLVTPKKQQMATFGITYDLSSNTSFAVEAAVTNNDLNTFSPKDSDDDHSYGLKAKFLHSQEVGNNETNPSMWNSSFSYEQIGRNFNYIERYRDVEFERDWNIQGMFFEGNEYLLNVSTGISKKNKI